MEDNRANTRQILPQNLQMKGKPATNAIFTRGGSWISSAGRSRLCGPAVVGQLCEPALVLSLQGSGGAESNDECNRNSNARFYTRPLFPPPRLCLRIKFVASDDTEDKGKGLCGSYCAWSDAFWDVPILKLPLRFVLFCFRHLPSLHTAWKGPLSCWSKWFF